MKHIYLITIFFLTGILSAYCQLKVEAGVKYQKSDATYSDYFFREIILKTGVELNKATESQNYDADADYALIWFAQDQVAIVKLAQKIESNFLDRMTGKRISQSSFDFFCRIYNYTAEGQDQDGDKWKFCFLTGSLRVLCM